MGKNFGGIAGRSMHPAGAGGRFIRNDKTTAQDQDKDLAKN
jgi:hypothetical protein